MRAAGAHPALVDFAVLEGLVVAVRQRHPRGVVEDRPTAAVDAGELRGNERRERRVEHGVSMVATKTVVKDSGSDQEKRPRSAYDLLMALIRCPDCGREISDASATCLGCGRPTPATMSVMARATRSGRSGVWPLYAAGFVVTGLVLFVLVGLLSERGRASGHADVADSAISVVDVPSGPTPEEVRSAQRVAEIVAEHKDMAFSTPQRRDKAVRWCANDTEACPGDRLESLITAAANDAEQDRLRAIAASIMLEKVVHLAMDGAEIGPQAFLVAEAYRVGGGQHLLDILPKTTLKDAAKDPGSARGGVARTSGTVIEIHAGKQGTFEGALAGEGANVVRFLTPDPTGGIYAESWASFRGVFVQQFNYANVSGGETQSLVLVGGFVK